MDRQSHANRAKDLLGLDFFLLAALILASRLATLLHETAGHAAVAGAFGGRVILLVVTLFGGGRYEYVSDASFSPSAAALVAAAGLAVNAVTGAIVLLLLLPPCPEQARRRLHMSLLTVLFAGVSLLGALAYGALGLYYRTGDAGDWMAATGRPASRLWIPLLAAAPAAAYLVVRAWGRRQERIFPRPTAAGRIGIAAATIGVAAAAYAGLFLLTQEPLGAADAPVVARTRLAEEIRRVRVEEAVERERAVHPNRPVEDIRRVIDHDMPPILPAEVPMPLPLVPVLAALYALGAFAALAKPFPETAESPARIPPGSMAATIAFAAAVLGALAWTEGRIY